MRLMARDLAKYSWNDCEAFALPSVRGRLSATPARMKTRTPAMSHKALRKPRVSNRRPPTKKPKPFMAFLDPVNQATHRNNWPEPPSDVALIADFEAVLVRSFATPAIPCAATTHATDTAALQAGLSAESSSRPVICRVRPVISMREMPKRVASQPPPRLAKIPAVS